MRSVVVVCVIALASAAHAEVLVPGSPPLTDDVVEHVTDFLEWSIDTPFTAAQRDEAKKLLVDGWRNKDRATIDTTQKFVAFRDTLIKATPAARDTAQTNVQTEMLAALRKNPNDATSRWLLGIYDAGHVAIAAGDPPLTRQVVNAYAELYGFVLGQAQRGKAIAPDRASLDTMAKNLSAEWSKLDAAERQQLARMPRIWAATRLQWTAMTEAERKKYRDEWAKSAAPPATAAKSPKTRDAQLAEMQLKFQQSQLYYKTMSNMIQGFSNTNKIIACNMSSNCSYRWVP